MSQQCQIPYTPKDRESLAFLDDARVIAQLVGDRETEGSDP